MRHIAITMGCPVGIGPEILLKFFNQTDRSSKYAPVILGDIGVLQRCATELKINAQFLAWHPGTPIRTEQIPVLELSHLNTHDLIWGHPTIATGKAMVSYIEKAVSLILNGTFSAMVTCPISKASLNRAGYSFPGHTEMLAALTQSPNYVMMMAGSSLRVTLATIHCSLASVPSRLNIETLTALIQTTNTALRCDFGISSPRIAVAALNPHAGESGLFGNEEDEIILPAIQIMQAFGIQVQGPFPPDTIFFKAASGMYDAVICMYHDQGLIPFKLLHFKDGVNVTLGLPIVRTSVDHGTAYDIAGKGLADPASLSAAVDLAASIAVNRETVQKDNQESNHINSGSQTPS
ncbi:MAG: 4-hydroxythreonine-4-phosphate dehydrogenase PdxA [Proteobacteria bacterium]|jgi:4-hydroxythreonine-4-phosphate dehydrogenase|nr:4-hydroxythreonine-4-phosphate dehydrogenase PdxA [Desulfocapsa sp.]MBU3945705.1 4-hydroxythreonine-4-phosphate dehydrogenase PdxA [Pseudomonadota bacterium]MCG2745028.1 4-hydroxythreonine-4-phosphate dehydrogenase PdxA [Desulfobacteraceae bacterium]MBU4027423.1 4-hydroxythreonine-4-phosphate dehydrogenase PdxA [Pseudomonadota bacterium]MBU4044544.1 4-hydroxythreonine-4-phosphate dehydrogenase PdxA [Pseudomonadota bacterium]